MNIIFNKEAIIQGLQNYPMYEDKVNINETEDDGYLSEEDQEFILNEAVLYVEKWDNSFLEKQSKDIKLKANGKFRKGSVVSLFDIDIASYVTDFTSCWFHDRIALRAIDEDTLEVSLERTQTTY
jgi:hypothetical protein